jgi:toxin ParE1/3/4
VAKYRLSRRAESDLLSIGSYTLESWGEAQFSRYLEKLESCCQAVAENPNLGRPCTDIRPGLRRINEGKHVIFIVKNRAEFSFPAFSTSACCQKDIPLMRKGIEQITVRQRVLLRIGILI